MKKNFYMWCMALFAVLFISSCHRAPESAQLIPDDAIAVLRWDVKGTLDQAGENNMGKFSKYIKSQLKDADINAALRKKVENIIDDPKSLGLDLRDPIYFVGGTKEVKSEWLFVGSVYDKDDFTDFLKALEKEEAIEGMNVKDDICSAYGQKLIIVYDKNKFAITQRKYSQEDEEAIDELKDLFDNDGKNSLADDESFKVFDSKGGLAQLLLRGDGLYNAIGSSDKKSLKRFEKQMDDARLEDYDMIYALDFKDGEAELSGELVAKTTEADNYLEKMWGYLGDIDGSLLGYISDNALVSAAAHLDGEKLYEYIKPLLKDNDEEEVAQIKKIITAINGDAVFGLYDMVEDNAVFDCYVSSKNNNLLIPFSDTIVYESEGENRYSKNVKAYKWVGYDYYDTYDSDMDTVAVGDSYDDYMDFSNPYREVTVGKFVAEYKNKVTYFGVSEEPAPFKKAKNAVDSEGFAGKKFYARFNPKALLNMKSFKENEDKDYMKDAKNIINLFDYAELSTEGKGKASLRVVMNDKNISPLEILAENLLELFEKYTN